MHADRRRPVRPSAERSASCRGTTAGWWPSAWPGWRRRAPPAGPPPAVPIGAPGTTTRRSRWGGGRAHRVGPAPPSRVPPSRSSAAPRPARRRWAFEVSLAQAAATARRGTTSTGWPTTGPPRSTLVAVCTSAAAWRWCPRTAGPWPCGATPVQAPTPSCQQDLARAVVAFEPGVAAAGAAAVHRPHAGRPRAGGRALVTAAPLRPARRGVMAGCHLGPYGGNLPR